MKKEKSVLEKARLSYKPGMPAILRSVISGLKIKEEKSGKTISDARQIKEIFPKTFGQPILKLAKGKGPKIQKPLSVGVVLSGGQAPGGHNVIVGISDGIRAIHPKSRLYGFKGGPKGIFTEKYVELDPELLNEYRNTGGFDMIGSGRDKIENADQLAACKTACEKLQLGALVIIGGDDSNTNAAVLAEYFLKEGVKTGVIGIPKTIDGDLKSDWIETSFGFDTACKVYSELIGNICRDALSARKYWHFIKLMGRNASHVTLECALATHPNIALIGEEVNAKKMTLAQIVEEVALVIKKRSEAGKFFGVCLVPEGLIEFIPEIRILIKELNVILAKHKEYFKTLKLFTDQQEFVNQKLSRDSSYVFSSLPAKIQQQLLYDRDKHGNVQVSKIETENLLIEQVRELLGEWAAEKKADSNIIKKFSTQNHFLGYEGRCSFPSNFDANYTYSLGRTASILIAFGKTGYMAALSGLTKPADKWQPCGVPLTSLMNMETRNGKESPVIKKALVNIKGAPFKAFAANRGIWEMDDDYVFPGAIQYFGTPAIADITTQTLVLERKQKKA
ncbi:diphosphate--fructose-6-phosphate 1-phosphotransferase [Candidatus Sumerlaeota bacterium]|nr:diphosphate--fructose-6-phosphate 1-phosphotransferase [Candidatus Sumerlaeota bacterium]